MTARLAVEPGATDGWWKWVGLQGDVLGLDRFGASAPGTTVLEELGFTSENIADARARAARRRDFNKNQKKKETSSCPPSRIPPLRLLSALGQSVWIDNLSRESTRDGHLQEPARRLLGGRRHLQPVDLPEGDGLRRRLRAAAARTRRRAADQGRLLGAGRAGHPRGMRPVPPGLGRRLGPRRLRLAGGRSRASPTTRWRPSAKPMRLHEVGRPAEPDGQDPRHQAGPARRSRTSSPRANRSTSR